MAFTYGRQLGKGHFSKVYLERYKRQNVAVKLYNDEYIEINDKIVREIRTLQGLNHDNVVEFLGALQVDRDYVGQVAIIMEYCAGGSLHKALRAKSLGPAVGEIDDDTAFPIVAQIASGLKYLHDRDILHRDLKPQNILFRDVELTEVVIADFGMADSRNYASYMGATLFQPDDERYSKRSDVFSLGRVACCVLVNEAPKDGRHIERIVRRALRKYELDPNVSDILGLALSIDRYERPTVGEFADIFNQL